MRTLDGSSHYFAVDAERPSLRPLPEREARPAKEPLEAGSGLTRRGVVYEYIRAHPGCHIRGMARGIGLGTGDLQYHLYWLEKNGYVETKRIGFYRFVFPTLMFQEGQEVLLGLLSQDTPREILLSLLEHPKMTQGDLARTLGHSQPTISWHMGRLVRLGVVAKKRASRGLEYEVIANSKEVSGFVKKYHPGAWAKWADRLGGVVVGERPKSVELIGPS